MQASKTTNQDRCLKEIQAMNFFEKCQCRLDHKTARVCMAEGMGMKPVGSVGRSRGIPSLPQAVKCEPYWARFFMENDLLIWDSIVPEAHYDFWVEHFLFSPTDPSKS